MAKELDKAQGNHSFPCLAGVLQPCAWPKCECAQAQAGTKRDVLNAVRACALAGKSADIGMSQLLLVCELADRYFDHPPISETATTADRSRIVKELREAAVLFAAGKRDPNVGCLLAAAEMLETSPALLRGAGGELYTLDKEQAGVGAYQNWKANVGNEQSSACGGNLHDLARRIFVAMSDAAPQAQRVLATSSEPAVAASIQSSELDVVPRSELEQCNADWNKRYQQWGETEDRLRAEIKGLQRFKASVDEALNTGDGMYKP